MIISKPIIITVNKNGTIMSTALNQILIYRITAQNYVVVYW